MRNSKIAKIRLISPKDKSQLQKLLNEAKKEKWSQRGAKELCSKLSYFKDINSCFLSDPTQFSFVATIEQQVVGLIIAKSCSNNSQNDSTLNIEVLYIDPAFRRNHIATLLLLSAINFAGAHNYSAVELTVLPGDRAAKSFCEAHGLKARALIMSGQIRNSQIKLASGAVVIEKNKILLVKRANEPNKGKWAFPGGKLLTGEDGKSAALRELYEETSLIGKEPHFIGAEPISNNEFFVANYKVKVNDYRALKPGEDALEAKFFSLNELDQIDIVDSVKNFIKYYDLIT